MVEVIKEVVCFAEALLAAFEDEVQAAQYLIRTVRCVNQAAKESIIALSTAALLPVRPDSSTGLS